MLGKLMKYDLRSGIRTFALIWIGLAALAAINGLTLRIAFDGDIQSAPADTPTRTLTSPDISLVPSSATLYATSLDPAATASGNPSFSPMGIWTAI